MGSWADLEGECLQGWEGYVTVDVVGDVLVRAEFASIRGGGRRQQSFARGEGTVEAFNFLEEGRQSGVGRLKQHCEAGE